MATAASALSHQDIQDLQDISAKLPPGDPRQKKISVLLNSQMTEFERARQPENQPGALSGAAAAAEGALRGLGAGAPTYGDVGRIAMQTAGEDADRKAMGRSTAYRVAAPLAGALVPGLNPAGMEQSADTGDAAGILGKAVVPGAIAASPYIAKGAGAVRSGIADALHTSEGTMKPGVNTAARIVGAGAGAIPGIVEGSPYGAVAGAGAGAGLGPSLMEAMFPGKPAPVYPGGPFPAANDFYAARGAEFDAARKQGNVMDKLAAQRAANAPDQPTTTSPGAPLPSVDEFYNARGAEFDAARRQSAIMDKLAAKRAASATEQPVAVNPGAPFPSIDDFYNARGAENTAIMRNTARAEAMNRDAVAPEPNGESPATPTGKLYKLPVPNEAAPGENPAYMASTKRNRLLNLARQGRAGAGDQLRNIGNTVLYTQESYPPPRSIDAFSPNAVETTPTQESLKVSTDSLGVRWATDGVNRVSIPKGVPPEEVEVYARPKLDEQARLRKSLGK